jgi:nucleoside-diphosphate-sugar epimerase
MTKAATEALVGVYFRSRGVPGVGLRYFTAYGPRQRPDMAFSRFIARALDGRPLPVFGDGSQVRDFTFISDVVEGTIAAARAGVPGSVYNIGGGHPVRLTDMLGLLGELLECPLEFEHRPTVLGDADGTLADGGRAARELGFVPRTTLQEGLATQLAWAREHPARTSVDRPDRRVAQGARALALAVVPRPLLAR